MLTEYEAQRLQADLRRESNLPAKERLLRDMRREPAWHLGVVLKCAACLLILAGLALIGRTGLQSEAPFGAPAAGESAQPLVASESKPLPLSKGAEKAGEDQSTVSAEHHRKAVFDARRRTWEQRSYSEDKRIAGARDEP